MSRAKHKERLKLLQLRKLIQVAEDQKKTDGFLECAFPEQVAFIQDPSQMKAALCTRRAGKSTACAIYLIITALRHPGTNCLYIALTRGQGKSIMLSENGMLPTLLERFGVDAKINLTDLSVTFPNKSIIYLMGMDATPQQAKTLLGNKYKLVVFDEAGSYRQNLYDMVMRLRPAMVDKDNTGTICLIGTPENERNFFYRVTGDDLAEKDKEPGWSVHRWSYAENPYTHQEIEKQIAKLRRDFPGIDTDPKHPLFPMFQQHYMGKWVIDRSRRVYAFDYERNVIERLPPGKYTYCAGVDFGFVDAATVVTVAYREHDPTLYVVDVFKERGLDPDTFAVELVRYDNQYSYSRRIADHDPATILNILTRYNVHLENAEKTDKIGFIEMMNAEWIRGRLKVVVDPEEPKTLPLVEELTRLIWNKTLLEQGIKREDDTKDNHATDALLYVWRSLYHYLATPMVTEVRDPMQEYANLLRKRTSEAIQRRLRKQHGRYYRQGI